MPREAVNFYCLLLGLFFPPLWLIPLASAIGEERRRWRETHPTIPPYNAAFEARLQAERREAGLDLYPPAETPLDRRVRKQQRHTLPNPYKSM